MLNAETTVSVTLSSVTAKLVRQELLRSTLVIRPMSFVPLSRSRPLEKLNLFVCPTEKKFLALA